MSKLSNRIRRANRTDPAPLGFGTMTRTQSPGMLTIVRLGPGDAGKVGDAAKAGADAVIIDGDAGKLKDAGALIVGVRPESADREAAMALREAGADFLVLDPSSALAEALLNDTLGFVLELREGMDDTHLRLLGELNLDAIIVTAPEAPVTLAKFLEFRRIGALARAALLVEVDPAIDSSLLHVLRESGTAGVIVPAAAIEKIGDLRERIASLPARVTRRRDSDEHAQALVPASTGGHDDDYEDDDDD